tara:strand:- start:6 stop:224 length:219 start_codon:yes stop_codon:yes gene_type:complete
LRNQPPRAPFWFNGLANQLLASAKGRIPMKKFLTMLLFGGTALTLSACNTIDGVGEDVESVGDCVDGVEGNC